MRKTKLPVPVGDLTRALTSRRIIGEAFEWPLEADDCATLLGRAYVAEVLVRRRRFQEDAQVEKACRALGDYLANPEWRFGAFLLGVCGNGKTTLLLALQNATNLLNAYGGTALPRPYDRGMLLVTAQNLAMQARRDYKGYREVVEWPLLAIDDVGSEPVEAVDFGNVVSPVVELLEHRYRRMLPTFCSSNLTPAQVSKRYGTRIADRLREMFAVIEFDKADSYRGAGAMNEEG